jgi:hypothetical protein
VTHARLARPLPYTWADVPHTPIIRDEEEDKGKEKGEEEDKEGEGEEEGEEEREDSLEL